MKTRFTVFLIYFSISFTSCTSRDEKLRMLSKSWVYSEETYQEKLSNLTEIEKNGTSAEKKSAQVVERAYKKLGKVAIEFESTGHFIQGFSKNNTLSRLNTTTGSWEVDEDFKKIEITTYSGKEIFTIKELTENSLQLSYYKNGEETIHSYVPFTEDIVVEEEKKLYKDISKSYTPSEITIEQLNNDTPSEITIEQFNNKNMRIGWIIKKDSIEKGYLFYDNREFDTNPLMKIDGKILELNFEEHEEIDEKSLFYLYKTKNYDIRLDFNIVEEKGKVKVYNATIVIDNGKVKKEFKNLYAENYN